MLETELLRKIISDISYIKEIDYIHNEEAIIKGKVKILFDGLASPLDFDFEIYPTYPLKFHQAESIKFFNKDLIGFNHVMQDGSICIHNSHNTQLQEKLIMDFDSLKKWIEKYYINKNKDTNYEHIVVKENLFHDSYFSYIFTDVNHTFKIDDFGEVEISELNSAIYKDKFIQNFLVNSFKLNNHNITCKWSTHYQNLEKQKLGLFYFLGRHPAKYDKFIFKNWEEFDNLFSQEFLNNLHSIEKRVPKNEKGKILPLFIGYNTINDEIHWQVTLLEIGKFPIKGEPERLLGQKTGKWYSKLINENINWALSRNSSYQYFFGRGILHKSITESRILVIGLGAIGSMLAKTLTRGGCKDISIVDYDMKEPENVCRSEYLFQNGLSEKVFELQRLLIAISPFVDVTIFSKNDLFESFAKTYYKDVEAKKALTSYINTYDIVFDCTTDNDLMYILDSLELKCDLINMSITNHAQELVCAFSPNTYHFVYTLFSGILKNDLEDLYEPTGCWNPTFKASYNDINTLVQFAIWHINNLFRDSKKKNNFVIKTSEDNLNLEIKEY